MRRKKTVKPPPRISFFPYRQDIARIQVFADLLAEEHGLAIHPTQREVMEYILDFAEEALATRRAAESADELNYEPAGAHVT